MRDSNEKLSSLYIQIPALVAVIALILTLIEILSKPSLVDAPNLYLAMQLGICSVILLWSGRNQLLPISSDSNQVFLLVFFGTLIVFASQAGKFSLNVDEAKMVYQYSRCLPFTAGLLQNNPPLSGIFSVFNFLPFSPTEFSLRLFPAIFMATSCALIAHYFYEMGFSRLLTIAIALFFASNRYTIYYSRRARSISLGVMLLLCLLIVTHRVLQEKKYKNLILQFFAILLLALLSLGLQPVSVGIGIGIFALLFLREAKKSFWLLGSLVLAALVFLPFQLQLLESRPKSNDEFELLNIFKIFYSYDPQFYKRIYNLYFHAPLIIFCVFFVLLWLKGKGVKFFQWLKNPLTVLLICILFSFLCVVIPAFEAFSNGLPTPHYFFFLFPLSVFLLGWFIGFIKVDIEFLDRRSVQIGIFLLSLGFFGYQMMWADYREKEFPNVGNAIQAIVRDNSDNRPFLFTHLCVFGSEDWCPSLPIYSEFYLKHGNERGQARSYILDEDINRFYRKIFEDKISTDRFYFLFPVIDAKFGSEIKSQFLVSFSDRTQIVYSDDYFVVMKVDVELEDSRSDLLKVLFTAKSICTKFSNACLWTDGLLIAAHAGLENFFFAKQLLDEIKKKRDEIASSANKKYHFDPEFHELNSILSSPVGKNSVCDR